MRCKASLSWVHTDGMKWLTWSMCHVFLCQLTFVMSFSCVWHHLTPLVNSSYNKWLLAIFIPTSTMFTVYCMPPLHSISCRARIVGQIPYRRGSLALPRCLVTKLVLWHRVLPCQPVTCARKRDSQARHTGWDVPCVWSPDVPFYMGCITIRFWLIIGYINQDFFVPLIASYLSRESVCCGTSLASLCSDYTAKARLSICTYDCCI